MAETARPNWTMVRLRNETLASLREIGKLWFEASAWREDVPRPNERNEISIDAIVQELLKRDQAHRNRAKAQSAKRKRKHQ